MRASFVSPVLHAVAHAAQYMQRFQLTAGDFLLRYPSST
jgi:hypothetical protein